jgi:hypothetical protein
MAGDVKCPKCRASIYDPFFNNEVMVPCAVCSTPLRILAFPALQRPVEVGSTGERILVEGESSCFYHPSKRASICCEHCGRFICLLCDIAVNGKHLCAACLNGEVGKGNVSDLRTSGFRYDRAAFSLVILSLILVVAFVVAPAAIYYCIKGLREKDPVMPKKTRKLIVLLVIACLETIISFVLLYFIFANK